MLQEKPPGSNGQQRQTEEQTKWATNWETNIIIQKGLLNKGVNRLETGIDGQGRGDSQYDSEAQGLSGRKIHSRSCYVFSAE